EARVARPPAQVLPAQQADRAARGRRLGGVGVAVAAAVRRLHRVEELRRLGQRRVAGVIDFQAGHLAALERHHLPAHDRGGAALARFIAPATALALGGPDEVDRPLGRPLQPWVLRQAVRLADRDGRQAVAVHVAAEEALAVLLADQEVERGLDLL